MNDTAADGRAAKRKLIKGNEACVFGALMGGATHFFGYPITPASEIAHAASLYFTRAGRTFLQAESEVSSINMLYGAASTGARAMTASSGPGISLMQEGISYLAGAQLPAVVVDIQRAGPGLGNIWPEQSDYHMVVKGGAHGNYKNVVYAPNSAQEMCDFAYRAFEAAETWRATVFILSDAYIGQMMEPVRIPRVLKRSEPRKAEWAVRADAATRGNLITSIFMNARVQSEHNRRLQEKYRAMEGELVEWEEVMCEDAAVILVSFGVTSRICLTAVHRLRAAGVAAGLFRPRTLFPFPSARLEELAARRPLLIAAELNNGQMADDVELAVRGRAEVRRYNWYGGVVPSTAEVAGRVQEDVHGRA